MTNILISWIGATDLRVMQGNRGEGVGPIAQACITNKYSDIILISDYSFQKTKPFCEWLQAQTTGKVKLQSAQLTSPTNYTEIYSAASKVIESTLGQFGKDASITFHLSPGTSAMAAVWIILSKTKFPAELIESSRDHGVNKVSIPFDISADFIPHLYKKADQNIVKMAAGVPINAPAFDDIIYRSESMQKAIIRAQRVSLHSVPVLIEGESGTGKELFARAIHEASPRKNSPFKTINCGAIPTELVESILFGHEKGAFTGATERRSGLFEEANKGTIFLDEIGELPKEIQVKLLRTIQEHEVTRVGTTTSKKIDIRIIAATNRILIDEVAGGTFREDLFYRLAVAVIKLPPLRDRTGDITWLTEHFLEKINNESRNVPDYKSKNISVAGKKLLLNHSWPGNIRELQNTLTRAMVWADGETLDKGEIAEALLQVPVTSKTKDDILEHNLGDGFNINEILEKVRSHYYRRALSEAHSNKKKSAQLLGLPSYQTLTNWLKKNTLEI